MADKIINNNGHLYVDLELPSGTLWATCNVGADKPTDSGLYFQWGDTQGYTKEQVDDENGEKKFSSDRSDYKLDLKYTNPSDKLKLEDDAAHVYMGGDWHMPSPEQIKELIDNTTTAFATLGGKSGMAFTSKNDTSKSIFFPATGFAWDGSIRYSEDNGNVWSSMLNDRSIGNGECLDFSSLGVSLNSYYRNLGFSVRGVIDKKFDKHKENKSNMNLDLTKILKDVPKGSKLWSPICGNCELFDVNTAYNVFPIVCIGVDDGLEWHFKADGSFTENTGVECLLFPSKENRDWSTFKVPKKPKEFKSFQKVLVKFRPYYAPKNIWEVDFYSHYDEYLKKHKVLTYGYCTDDNILPYEGNEDKVGNEIRD